MYIHISCMYCCRWCECHDRSDGVVWRSIEMTIARWMCALFYEKMLTRMMNFVMRKRNENISRFVKITPPKQEMTIITRIVKAAVTFSRASKLSLDILTNAVSVCFFIHSSVLVSSLWSVYYQFLWASTAPIQKVKAISLVKSYCNKSWMFFSDCFQLLTFN